MTEAQKRDKAGTIVLDEPVTFEGNTVTELPYDFGTLKGKDIMELARSLGGGSSVSSGQLCLAMDFDLQCGVFARAANVPLELLEQLSPGDLMAAAMVAEFFMLPGLAKAAAA